MTLVSIEKESWNTLDRLVNTITDLGNAHLDETNQDQAVMLAAIDELRSCWSMTDRWDTNRAGSLLGVRDQVENFYNDLYAAYCSEVTGIDFSGPTFQQPLLCMLRVVVVSIGRLDNTGGIPAMKSRTEMIEAVHKLTDVTKRHVQAAFLDIMRKRKKEVEEANSDL